MKTIFNIFLGLLLTFESFAQNVGINSTGTAPDNSAMLDVVSTDKGMLVPRVNIVDLNTAAPVTAPAISLLVYNTNTTSGVGYYFWDGTKWINLKDANSNADEDWYKVGGTTAPTNINDNIFTQGNVGVGLLNPTVRLQISAPNETESQFLITNVTGGLSTYIKLSDAGNTHFGGPTASPNAIVINNGSGNVGIGTTAPQTALSLAKNKTIGVATLAGADDGYIVLSSSGADNSTRGARMTLSGVDRPVHGGKVEFHTGTTGADNEIEFWTAGTQRAVITNLGNLGLGIISPQSLLHLDKAMPGGDVAQLKIENSSGSALWIGQNHSLSNGYSFLKTHALEDLYFQIGQSTDNLSPDMVIKSNGNVGIGTTAPDEKLHINGNIALSSYQLGVGNGIFFRDGFNSGSSPYNMSITSDTFDGGTSPDALSINGYEGVSISTGHNTILQRRLTVVNNGNVGINTTTPSQKLHVIGNILASGTITSSDVRYKQDIKSLENSSEIIKALDPVSYHFKEEYIEKGQFDDKLHFGVIAQDLEKVLPNLVYEDNEGFKAVNYTEIIALLIKSNQELQKRIEELEKD